ncbi:hypothetical protein ABMC88_01950 [Sulfitobacter sp. HNIBRBA2951]|uniref:hypothetical protein n=1 Tax=Sulfitobacter aquimarinus TaxID=3158557 RepID=UPI0032DFC655
MELPLTTGCALYGLSGIGFGLALLVGAGLTAQAARMRRKRTGPLDWAQSLQVPQSSEDKRRGRRAMKAFAIAFVCFSVGVSVEIWGLSLGLFGNETACPSGWQQPRSLRALSS